MQNSSTYKNTHTNKLHLKLHGLVSVHVLLDVKPAFDTNYHNIILQRWEHVIGVQ